MNFDYPLPDIGEGISEATLIEWLVDVGDTVEEGDDVVIVSTDKADVELASPCTGTVSQLCGKAGDLVEVGTVLMRFQTDGPVATSEQNEPAPSEQAPETDTIEEAPEPPLDTGNYRDEGRPGVVAAPATRKLGAETGVDIAKLKGSGPEGQITRADVEAAAAGPTKPPAAGTPAKGAVTTETLSGMRAAMATRMARSLEVHAHSTIDFQVEGEALLDLHKRLSGMVENEAISLTALLAKCVASALMHNPRLNSTIDEEGRTLSIHSDINLGVALASDKGLVVPVLRDVAGKKGNAVARELNRLTERGRAGELSPEELRGGTFTLSNTGGLEKAAIISTTPILNTPQTAILWVSRLCDRVWVRGDQAVVAPVLNATIAFDHRCHDGAEVIAFINDFSSFVMTPEAAIFR